LREDFMSWFKDFTRVSRRPRRRFVLSLERLEDRVTPSTFLVSNLDDSGGGSLRQAIAQSDGTPGPNEIDFAPGLSGTITLTSGQLTIANNDVAIVGPGADGLSVSGNRTSRVLEVDAVSAAISGLTITGGSAPGSNGNGGGLYNNGGTMTIAGCVVRGNTAAGVGGGLYNYNATVTITKSTLSDNSAAYGGGLYNNSYNSPSSVTITDSTFSGNSATVSGGGLDCNSGGVNDNEGSIFLTGCTLRGNSASLGGGLHSYGGMVTVAGTTVSNNSATNGGGLYCVGKAGSLVTINGSTISNNAAEDSAGLANNAGTMTITDSTISGNSATGDGVAGGGIDNYTGSTLTITRCTVSGNSAVYGSGIDSIDGATLTISDSTISANRAYDDGKNASLGGGIYSYNSTLMISNSTISDNAAAYGGGLYNNSYQSASRATIMDCTLRGNSAPQSGGGIDNNNGATLTISGSTISANTTQGIGGGLHTFAGAVMVSRSTIVNNSAINGGGLSLYSGTLTISDSTITDDSAGDSGGGVWAAAVAPAAVALTGSTLAGNRADARGQGGRGGGLFVDPGSAAGPVLDSTLIAGNLGGAAGTSRDDVSGTLDRGGAWNLIGDGTGSSGLSNGAGANQIGSATSPINPLLAPLASYGGPTQTLPLLPGSPALNTGDPARLGVPDQRGVTRTGGVNVGAYQASPSAFTIAVPSAVTAGAAFNFTVTAHDSSGNTATGYTGTVQLTSTDSHASLPGNVTLTNGVGTFSVTLNTVGTWTINAQDVRAGIAGVSDKITVSPLTYRVTVAGAGPVPAGSNVLVSVQAVDAAGNPVAGYSGPATVTVSVTPSSAGSSFPTAVSLNGSGLGLFLASFQKMGSYTIAVAPGSFNGGTAAVTVGPGPAVKLDFATQPLDTPTGVRLPPLYVQLEDPYGNPVTSNSADVVTLGVASGPGPGAPGFTTGSTTTAAFHNGLATFSNLTLVVPGSYTLSELVPALFTGPNTRPFRVLPLQVTPGSFSSSASGFSLQFNAPYLVDSHTPVLYGVGFGGSAPVPSVTLTQIRDGSGNPVDNPVEGSLVLNPGSNSILFLATNTAYETNNGSPVLLDGTYAVVVHGSGPAAGFQALNAGGSYLDGLGSGLAGSGDFTTTFSVNTSGQDIVWVPDTADGPGQALVAPGDNQTGGGYPIYLSDRTGAVTDVQVTLTYNPALLTLTGVAGAGFMLLSASTPGLAVLKYSGPALPTGSQVPIGFLTAMVPSGSAANPTPYRAKDLLHLSNIAINGGAVAAVGGDALHLVAYVGDANGDGTYSSGDAALITRAGLQLDSGFASYPLVDPVIVADTDGSGYIPADAALQVNEAGVGHPTRNLPMPAIPAGVVFQPTHRAGPSPREGARSRCGRRQTEHVAQRFIVIT
jgi:hypothetical protein